MKADNCQFMVQVDCCYFFYRTASIEKPVVKKIPSPCVKKETGLNFILVLLGPGANDASHQHKANDPKTTAY